MDDSQIFHLMQNHKISVRYDQTHDDWIAVAAYKGRTYSQVGQSPQLAVAMIAHEYFGVSDTELSIQTQNSNLEQV